MAMNAKAFFVVLLLALAAALNNGVGQTPPLGWSTWMTCSDERCTHDACSEDEVRTIVEAMESNGMKELGYDYVLLDDCWAYPRDEVTNKLRWDPDRFPSGMPALVQWVHGKGFKFGLYTSAGNQTCNPGGRPFPIPGSRDHYELDAQTFADWEVDHVKLDWCGDIKKEIWNGAKAHRDFAEAMLATKRPMFLEAVAGFWFLGKRVAEVANAWRFCEDHHDEWKSFKEQMICHHDQTLLHIEGAPGGWPYMDMLMTGGKGCSPFTPSSGAHCPQQSDGEYRTAFAIWSLIQSPVIVSTDVRNMTAVMTQTILNKELAALHQSTATPPGKQLGHWACSEALQCGIWGRQVKADGSQWVVALVNTGAKDHDIVATFSHFGWTASDSAVVTELWSAGAAPAMADGDLRARVPSHDTALFLVQRVASSAVGDRLRGGRTGF